MPPFFIGCAVYFANFTRNFTDMKRILLCLLLVIGFVAARAQKVDTVAVYSPSMEKNIKNVIIFPAEYSQQSDRRFPVVYLLHGYGGRYDSWISIKSELPQVASEAGVIIVCPDGQNSWYWDSPVNPKVRFDTYVSRELISYIDKNYRTVASSAGRAVTGFSMGGHGGLWLGFTHQDVFGACGSICGGVDIRPFPENWDMKRSLGSYGENRQRWDEHTVINQLYRLSTKGSPAIIIDCGVDDFFYEVNEELHRKLLYYNIPHDYISRPGAHTREYWVEAFDTQLLFFKKYFKSKKN